MVGKTVGPFVISALLGKGGMGEVYQALDTRLDRQVALKILPESFAADAQRLARFEREAKVLASLQHQNIASIFGLENLDGAPALVMELAPGDDLSLRMERGGLSRDEIEKIARQLARGLEYAHERGIVHRDLKPANVKVHQDGQVKILDFGLARAMAGCVEEGDQNSDQAQLTLTQGLTTPGTVIGTAAYMSPEQARGYEVDRRSDIWAFGVILFEMLSGQRLFAGETSTDTLAAIIHKEPDFDEVAPDASPLLVQVCRRCLVKDPGRRMRDMGEVRVALEDGSGSLVGLSGVHAALPPDALSAAPRARLPWIITAVLGVALVGAILLGLGGRLGPRPEPAPLIHASVPMPEKVQLNLNPAAPGPVRVSPDSRRLAFTATDTTGQVLLYVRDLDEREPRAIAGTKGAHYPFWAPDSREVAFFTAGTELARVDVVGGPVVAIGPAENGKGGSWHENGNILLAPSHISAIQLVSADGGPMRPVTNLKPGGEYRSHRFPRWLPDGRHFIYVAVVRAQSTSGQASELRLGSVDGSVDRLLMPCQGSAEYADGHILFVHDGVLMVRPFDPESLEFVGSAQPLFDGVMTIPAADLSVMSAAGTGLLAYSSGGGEFGNSQLFVVDLQEKTETPLHKPLITFGFDHEPVTNRLVLSLPDKTNGTFDIWILDMERDLRTRLTFDPESELAPHWSPDGQWIVYSSDESGVTNLFRRKASGLGKAEKLFDSPVEVYATDWSADGSLIAYTDTDSAGVFHLGLFDTAAGKARAFRPPQGYNTGMGRFSPDGRWIAFLSTETGPPEVFVESLEPEGGRYRISASGGYFPEWSPGGNVLYYLNLVGEIVAVPVAEGQSGGLEFGAATVVAGGVESSSVGTFTINSKTGSLIVQRAIQARQSTLLSLVSGWQKLLARD